MKKLTLSLIILLNAIIAHSQTSTFNLGWAGTPEKILCAGDTWIIYGKESYGPGQYGVLAKFKKKGNEYEMVGKTHLPEELNDFRFANGKLQIVALRVYDCDYGLSDLYYYEMDTITFRTTKFKRIDEDFNLIQAGFATDSTIFTWTDDPMDDTVMYNINTDRKVEHALANVIGLGISTDFLSPIFNDNLLYVHSSIFPMSFLIDPNVKNLPRSFSPHSLLLMPIHNHRAVYSFGQDSLCVITDSLVLKMDTTFQSHQTILIPLLPHHRLQDNKLYLFDDRQVLTYSLPDFTLLSTDSLRGLPSGFKIKDVYPVNGTVAVVAHRDNSNLALNETVLKTDINSTTETERHEIMLDSVTFVKTDVTGLGQLNRYQIRATNMGQDTIKIFDLLFEHLSIRQCSIYDNSIIRMSIPPGESRTFTKDVQVHRAGKICFYASVPGHRLEDDMSDNSTCAHAWLGTNEFLKQAGISMYPNPTSTKLNIEGDLRSFKSLAMYSIDGRKLPVAVTSQNEESLTLDLSSIAKGVYFLKLQIGEKVMTEKVVKE